MTGRFTSRVFGNEGVLTRKVPEVIVRRIARPLLASIFISGGINALRTAEAHAQAAGPFLDKAIGQRGDALPAAVPRDPETLVKVDATAKIVAGSALALGKFPRVSSLVLLGSLVPTTAAGHGFWQLDDPTQRQEQLTQFVKNVSLAGGLLLAAADTEGKPSVGWRARRAARKAGKQAEQVPTVVEGKARTAQQASCRCARKAKKNFD